MIAASDGMHAMELWHDRGDEVDLVLTDTVMPSMTGPELGRRLSAESPGVKFLYVSGSSWTSTCGAWASKVVFAADGVSAIAAAPRSEPDIILLDIGLPAGNGFVVMERLHAMPQFPGVPIIVISARDPRETEVRALAAGATCFLPKPLDLVGFAETVVRLSGRSGRPPHASVDLRESPPLDS